MNNTKLWMEKHRPTTFDDYIFHDESHKKQILNYISSGQIPHLLLTGVQGTGKTTLSKIIVDALDIDKDMDVLTINASDENNVDTIRDKIKIFAQGYAMSPYKIVRLEEMDYLTPSAQAVLRNIMEEYSDNCRFIGTCNYDHKIIPALKSRMQEYKFKAPDLGAVTEYIAKILLTENVEFSLDILDKYISIGYPDIRKIINLIQPNVIDNKLVDPHINVAGNNDYRFQLLDLLETNDFTTVRSLVCKNALPDDFEDLYRFFYMNLNKCPKFSDTKKYEAGIVLIASYLFKNTSVADQEINFAALCIELGRL